MSTIDFSQRILRYDGEPATEPLFKVVDSDGALADPRAQNLSRDAAMDKLQRLGDGHRVLKMDDRPLRLGPFLAPYLGAGKVPADKEVRAFVVARRIYEGGKDVELAAEDVAMISDVVKATSDITPWVKASVRYLLDRGSIGEDERKVFDAVYNRKPEPAKDGTGKAGRLCSA